MSSSFSEEIPTRTSYAELVRRYTQQKNMSPSSLEHIPTRSSTYVERVNNNHHREIDSRSAIDTQTGVSCNVNKRHSQL